MSLSEASLERALHDIHFAGGLSASVIEGEFGAARFTRDYLAMMSDLMETHPGVVREGFSMIPQEQGVDFDPLTDQQADRLPHQVAYNQWSGLVVPQKVVESRRYWADQWGIPFDPEKGFVVWNQTDGSRYVHELWRYVSRYGEDVLKDQFVHQPTGKVRTVREATLRQLDWMVRTIDASDLGLLEVQEFNPRQTSWSGVMRDGYDSYFHETKDGLRVPVNKDKPVAYLESQGLAVQAFADALKLFGGSDDPDILRRIPRWNEMVRELPDRAFEQFRWDEENAVVPAVDRDEAGKPRKVRLMSSVIGETLATPELYKNITDKTLDATQLTDSIVSILLSQEFMTPVGVRMLGWRHIASEGQTIAYQGPRVAWPVTQWRFADGLETVEWPYAAREIRINRTLGGLALTRGQLPEFWPVSEANDVGYRQAEPGDANLMRVVLRSLPSKGQGWTMTGALKAVRMARPTRPISPIERRLLEGIKDIPTPAQQLRQGTNCAYVIDM